MGVADARFRSASDLQLATVGPAVSPAGRPPLQIVSGAQARHAAAKDEHSLF